MYWQHFLHDHRTVNALRWAKTSNGLSEICTTHGTYSSRLTPMDVLQKLPSSKVHIRTEPPDYIDCVWILNDSFKTVEVEASLTEVIFDDGTRITVPVRKSFIDQHRKRLRYFLYEEGQLNYIFPSIKEFNQQYSSIVYKNRQP